MKKITVIALLFALTFSLAACGGSRTAEKPADATDPANVTAQIPNPVVDVDSAEAFKELGITLEAPENAQDVFYSIISGSIAQIQFTSDGAAYNLRASKTEDDISGVYGSLKETKELKGGAMMDELTDGETVYHVIRWAADGVNYSLTNTDGASSDAALAVYESLN